MDPAERWRTTWSLLDVAPPARLLAELVAAYAEPHRAYHTLQHLSECFAHRDLCPISPEDPAALELALWFHDAIYDTLRDDNEVRSAEWARRALADLPVDRVDRLEQLILVTRAGGSFAASSLARCSSIRRTSRSDSRRRRASISVVRSIGWEQVRVEGTPLDRGVPRCEGMRMPRSQAIERFAENLFLPECPRWHAGSLWLCDMWGHEVLRFSETGARQLVHRFPDAEDPGGLGWLPSGALLVVGMEGRCVHRLDPPSALRAGSEHALEYASPHLHADLKPLAAWQCNDMIVRRDGTAWVSHFGYDMFGGTTGFLPASLIRVDPDGRARVVAEDLLAPNGMALPDDEQTLFLSECGRSQILAFDVDADGSLTNRRVHAALPCAPGLAFAPPDGICLDEAGAVWAAEPIGKRVLRIEADGRVSHEIPFERAPLAVVLGGADRQTLYVCSSGEHDKAHRGTEPTGRVDLLRVDVPGAGRP